MLKILVSALKSAFREFCLNLSKFRETPQMPCSVTQVVVHRMTATINPYTIGVGKGMGIINKAVMHRWTGGVAFRKVAEWRRLKHVGC